MSVSSIRMEKVYLEKTLNKFTNLHKYWGISEYDKDHYKILIEREKNRMFFYCKSPQIQHRTTLVEWIKKISYLKKLDNSSVHLAVYLLDVFMDNHHIITERLYLVALVCLLLATKFEERDIKSLKAEDLNKMINNKYPLSDYFALEILILKHLRWNLFLPTAVEFVNYYIEFLLTDEDFENSNSQIFSDVWLAGKSIIQMYLDCVIIDIELMQNKPSLVASSIIAITRLELELSTIWPEQLITVTGFKLYDLKTPVSRLKKILRNSKRCYNGI